MTETAEPAIERPPRWGLGDAGLAFLFGMLGTIVTTAVYVGFTGDADAEDTGLIVAALVGLWLGFGAVALWASRRKGTGSLAEDYGLRIRPRDVGIGVLVGVLCQFVLVPAIVFLFSILDSSVDVGRQAEEVTGDAAGTSLLVLAPFLCLGAPLFEELYFRGLLQRAAVRRLGLVGGILISALAFGLVHLNLSGWAAVALVVALGAFGAVLSVLAHRTGRLGAGLVAHATFNGITLLALAAR
jgi:membrane protease YdiL (CAAX protease family)